IRNRLLGGRRSGVATAIGVSAGLSVWALATRAGLAVVLQASHPAFVALRVAGAAYLVYLGAHPLLAAVRPRSRTPGGESTARPGNPLPVGPTYPILPCKPDAGFAAKPRGRGRRVVVAAEAVSALAGQQRLIYLKLTLR